MLSRFRLAILGGVIISFLFLRAIWRKQFVVERAPVGMSGAAIRPTRLSTREQRVLLVVFLAGAVAWSLHLMVGYAIASMGCMYLLDQKTLFGFSAIPVLILLLTVPAAITCVYAGIVAYRKWRHAQRNQFDRLER